jgi:hypothetical protein
MRNKRIEKKKEAEEVDMKKRINNNNNNNNGTTRTLNFMKEMGVILLVEKRLNGQDTTDDSRTPSDTHR